MNKLRRLALLVSLGMTVFFAQAQQAQLISAMIDGCALAPNEGADEWLMLYSGGSDFTAGTSTINVEHGVDVGSLVGITDNFLSNTATSDFVDDLNLALSSCNFSFFNVIPNTTSIPAGSHILIFNADVVNNGTNTNYNGWCSAFQSNSSIYVMFADDPQWPNSGRFDIPGSGTDVFRSTINTNTVNFDYDNGWGNTNSGRYVTWNDGGTSGVIYSDYSGCQPNDLDALPVVLLNFDAVAMEDHISIWWSTAEELGNSHFIIERSANAMQWERIGMVGGHGTTQEVQHYEFKDQSPHPGRSYYRLTQVDFNGDSETFDIVAVDFDSEDTQLKVFPNPSSDFITVNCSEEIEHLSMIDTRGRTYQIAQEGSSGMNGRFDIRHLPNGIYRVMIYGKKTVFREKLIKVD